MYVGGKLFALAVALVAATTWATCIDQVALVGKVYVLVGPPGAGKGTQAKLIAERTGLLHLSTGDMLRAEVAADTEIGRTVAPFLRAGALVPPELVNAVLAARLARPDADGGVLLDGYPRTLPQLADLERILRERGLTFGGAIHFDIAEDEAVTRLAGRRVCPECKATFHTAFKPPREEGRCDECGGTLVRRADDEEATIRERFVGYRQETEPLLDELRRRGLLHSFGAEATPEALTEKILGVFNRSATFRP